MTISAKVIEHSTHQGEELCSLQLEYPRFIHSEFMTHRVFSRNASSSRAIPVKKLITDIGNNPAMPIHWGKNEPGMQAVEEHEGLISGVPREDAWAMACRDALAWADAFADAGYHKQIANRIAEPFQHIKVICTATEWDNFFALRLHKDAQPEIFELARCMAEAMENSTPVERDCHVPYVIESERDLYKKSILVKISTARCARVSYLTHDQQKTDIFNDLKLADMLEEAGHMSPFEHQAHTPVGDYALNGHTHTDRGGIKWSGNFRHWVQHRQLLWV